MRRGVKKKIIINATGSLESSVFSRLSSENIIEVVYVLHWDKDHFEILIPEFKKSAPVALWDIIEKGLSGDFSSVDLSLFTSDWEHRLRPFEAETLAMMERIDPARCQTYQQRRNLYIFLVCYWIDVVNTLEPEYFYSKEEPHEVVDFVLFNVCKLFGVKIIMGTRTSLPGVVLLPRECQSKLEKSSLIISNYHRTETLRNFVRNRINKPHEMPTYMADKEKNNKKGLKQTSRLSYVSRLIFDLKYIVYQFILLSRLFKSSILNEKISYIVSDELSKRASSYSNFQFFKRISSEYHKVANPNIPSNFVYFPLHAQPEKSTSPLGGRYNNMAIAVAMAAKALPVGWTLCVREHPSQFRQDHYAHIGRDRNYYRRLAGIPNVQLMSMDADHDSLLNRSKCVCTITGSVGWEAVLKLKPVMIFGDAWYTSAPGVVRVGTVEECKRFFESLSVLRSAISEKSIVEYVDYLALNSIYLYPDANKSRWYGKEFDLDANIQRLEKILVLLLEDAP